MNSQKIMPVQTDKYWRWGSYSLYAGGLGLILYFWLLSSFSLLGNGVSGSLLALGQLSGLLGMYSLLTQFVLISRAPWLEHGFGFDKLTRLHHNNGLIAFTLITAHIPLVVLGASGLSGLSALSGAWFIFNNYPYVPLAIIGYILLLVLIGTSITIVRRHLRYESWFWVHLLSFAIVLLIFWHQVSNGATLLQYDVFRIFWYGLFFGVLTHFVFFQIGSQLWSFARHNFVIERVEPAANGTVSIYISGQRMEKFGWRGGQFAKWRFLTSELGLEEHPFTISVEPNDKHLRLTPKAVGDYTAKLQHVRPGTKAVVSGPLGRFTLARSGDTKKVLLVAGGIGITPLRAMIGDELASQKDIVLLYSAKRKADLAFVEEFNKLQKTRQLQVKYILSDEKLPGFEHGMLDQARLAKLVPDIAQRQLFVCGPPSMMDAVSGAARQLGMPQVAIHSERFSLLNSQSKSG